MTSEEPVRIEVKKRKKETIASFSTPGRTGLYLSGLGIYTALPCNVSIPIPTGDKWEPCAFCVYDRSEISTANALMEFEIGITPEGGLICPYFPPCGRIVPPGVVVDGTEISLYVVTIPSGAWTKKDFINALQAKGPIPFEEYPAGGWLRGWSRTEPYMLEYKKGNFTLGIDIEAPRCKDNPPTGIDCVRWRCPGSHCTFISKACILPPPFVEKAQEAIRKLYGEIEYLSCMTHKPESSSYIPEKNPVDIKLVITNCGTKACRLKGVITLLGSTYIEGDTPKPINPNEQLVLEKQFIMSRFKAPFGFFAYHLKEGMWIEDESDQITLERLPPERCRQYFMVKNEAGVGISRARITILLAPPDVAPTTDVETEGYVTDDKGDFSYLLEKGKDWTAWAVADGYETQIKTFTACSEKPVKFVLKPIKETREIIFLPSKSIRSELYEVEITGKTYGKVEVSDPFEMELPLGHHDLHIRGYTRYKTGFIKDWYSQGTMTIYEDRAELSDQWYPLGYAEDFSIHFSDKPFYERTHCDVTFTSSPKEGEPVYLLEWNPEKRIYEQVSFLGNTPLTTKIPKEPGGKWYNDFSVGLFTFGLSVTWHSFGNANGFYTWEIDEIELDLEEYEVKKATNHELVIDIKIHPITCDGTTRNFASGCAMLLHYDKDKNGIISREEERKANSDFSYQKISWEELLFIQDTYKKGGKINDVCPSCFTIGVKEAILTINEAVDLDTGATLNAAKVYVDEVYVHHYTPEDLTFCDDCICDTYIACDFGTHKITIKKTKYEIWEQEIDIKAGDEITLSPMMKLKSASINGVVIVGESIIPEEIYLAKSSIFSMHVKNIGEESVDYKVIAVFTGIDVAKEYEFASEWSEDVAPGKSTKLDVKVTLPSDAIPPDRDAAIYGIRTILEAEEE